MFKILYTTFPEELEYSLMNRVAWAVRAGNYKIAGEIIKYGNHNGGYGFNFLHEQALLMKTVLSAFYLKSIIFKYYILFIIY